MILQVSCKLTVVSYSFFTAWSEFGPPCSVEPIYPPPKTYYSVEVFRVIDGNLRNTVYTRDAVGRGGSWSNFYQSSVFVSILYKCFDIRLCGCQTWKSLTFSKREREKTVVIAAET